MKSYLQSVARSTLLIGFAITAGMAQAATAKPVQVGTVHDSLFSVSFDGKRGLAAGAPGFMLETSDGADTWSKVEAIPTRLALLGVALKGDHAIAVGQQGYALKREAGTWKKVETGTEERLLSVAVNASGIAVAGGAFGTVLLSSDGGETWSSIKPDWAPYAEAGTEPHVYAVHVDDAGTITVAGEFELILRRTADTGEWTLLNKGTASLFALHIGSNGIAYAVGQDGAALRSGDGGSTWTRMDLGTKAILLGVTASSDDRVTVSGMREMRHSADGGNTWTAVSGGGVNTLWYQGIGLAGDGSTAMAVGQAGRILKIED